MDERRRKLRRLKIQVQRGTYTVDAAAVAAAVLARLGEQRNTRMRALEAQRGPQTECSYPRNASWPESTKTTLPFPGRTWPIQVKASS
jgi:hypothetical protein